MGIYLKLLLLSLLASLHSADAQYRRRRRYSTLLDTASWQTMLFDEKVMVEESADVREINERTNVIVEDLPKLINISSNKMLPTSKYSNSVSKYYFRGEEVPGLLLVNLNITMSSNYEREVCLIRNTSLLFVDAYYQIQRRNGSPLPTVGVEGGHFTVAQPVQKPPWSIRKLCNVRPVQGRGTRGRRLTMTLMPSSDKPKAGDIRISGHIPERNSNGQQSISITVSHTAIKNLIEKMDIIRAG